MIEFTVLICDHGCLWIALSALSILASFQAAAQSQLQKKPISLLLVILCILIGGCDAEFNDAGVNSADRYNASAEDGINIAMKRYRPSPDHSYTSGTPILLGNGLSLGIDQWDVYSKLDNYTFELPADSPDWAKNDPVIQNDNLKYFSTAHYLYLQGYDVWMMNYRGVGRDGFASDKGNGNVNIDVWCAMDFAAGVKKVREVTGKKPVIGGHSTGGLCAYLYLQGVTMDPAIVKAGDYLPHVTSSEELAVERNASVLGFLGFDPAGIPPLAFEQMLDTPSVFNVLSQEVLIDIDSLIPPAVFLASPDLTAGGLGLVFSSIAGLAESTPSYLPQLKNLFSALDFFNVENVHPDVQDFFVRNMFSSFYMGVVGQYAEWGINGEFREHWQNGKENVDLLEPPNRTPDDGYYYYKDNMSRMTVPAFSVFSSRPGLVDTATMIDIIYNNKTFNSKDYWIEIPDTAHVDIVVGYSAPKVTFPALSEWLENL